MDSSKTTSALPLLLTIPECARLAAISKSYAYELVASGVWQSVRIGRAVRVPRRWLEEWIVQQTERQAESTAGLSD